MRRSLNFNACVTLMHLVKNVERSKNNCLVKSCHYRKIEIVLINEEVKGNLDTLKTQKNDHLLLAKNLGEVFALNENYS